MNCCSDSFRAPLSSKNSDRHEFTLIFSRGAFVQSYLFDENHKIRSIENINEIRSLRVQLKKQMSEAVSQLKSIGLSERSLRSRQAFAAGIRQEDQASLNQRAEKLVRRLKSQRERINHDKALRQLNKKVFIEEMQAMQRMQRIEEERGRRMDKQSRLRDSIQKIKFRRQTRQKAASLREKY